jgi:sugar lactone lactonase YvrE
LKRTSGYGRSIDVRRILTICAVLSAAVGVMAISSGNALAARNYECEITGDSIPSPNECNGVGNPVSENHLGELYGVTVDSADNVWVTGSGRVEKFDPSGNWLTGVDASTYAPYNGGYARAIAFDNSSNLLVQADSGQNDIWMLDEDANLVNDVKTLYGGCCFLFVGVDNSGGPSDGDIYVAASPGLNQIYKLDPTGDAIGFSGSAPYIKPDKCLPQTPCTNTDTIQGTPSGELEMGYFPFTQIAVDSSGDLYVSEQARHVVDEFNENGEFIREFTGTPDEGDFLSTAGVAIDPTNDHLLVVDQARRTIEEFDAAGNYVDTIDGSDTTQGTFFQPVNVAVDSTGRLYVTDGGFGVEAQHVVHRFGPSFVLPRITYGPETDLSRTGVTVNAAVDPQSGSPVDSCQVQYGTTKSYGSSVSCSPDPTEGPPGSNFTTATAITGDISGLTADTTYHYRVTASNSEGTRRGKDHIFKTLPAVNNLTTLPATDYDDVKGTLNASFEGLGDEDFYYFDWGVNTAYGGKTPETSAGSGVGLTNVSAEISGLSPITVYHYRIVVRNATGISYGQDESFESLPSLPVIQQWSSAVRSDTATLHARINPGGGDTVYHLEYGTSTSYGASIPIPEEDIGAGLTFVERSKTLLDLEPGTTYHYRVVATNSRGTVNGEDRTFRTFPFFEFLHDPCPNALVRKQTNAGLLLDCRAFELASAYDAGGYDVESDLVPGQTQLSGYPDANNPSRLLYTVHYGAIPGTDNPTNFGPDPYVATRGPQGWTTSYVGIPANGTLSVGPFASPLLAADDSLSTFAFGGPNFCSPCFAGGKSGIPVRLPDGSLAQGMVGSLDPGPEAKPEGYVGKPISGDGRHLVFGSASKFEPDGNGNGDVTIYDRDLIGGATHVVSKTPAGATMTGPGIGELDLSDDGSRILIGKRVSVDAEGNVYWHLYVNVGDSTKTIDLTPSTASGVIYVGMSKDASQVYFTTPDQLAGGDTDGSADLYRADVSASSAVLTRVSAGNGAGDSDACSPGPNSAGPHWNVVGSDEDCGVVGIAAKGGVASGDGTVYFISPEVLASGGVADQPNLYAARPGSAPKLVTTIGPENPVVVDSVTDNEVRNTADFQVTPDGNVAAFTSRLSPTGYDNDGHSEVYRYDYADEEIICVSCPLTNARATGDAALASHGSSLTDDGRVFFTTTEALVLRDLNNKKDAYEWSNGEVAPISSGSSPLDSGLLSVSADGVDAYFFTHETFVPEDRNGNVMKIYDAREDGGFFHLPAGEPCQASDECHGAGSPEPPPPSIRTVTGTNAEQGALPTAKRCHRGMVSKRGRCVKRKHSKRKRHRKSNRRHG